jgi:hypothetical protein
VQSQDGEQPLDQNRLKTLRGELVEGEEVESIVRSRLGHSPPWLVVTSKRLALLRQNWSIRVSIPCREITTARGTGTTVGISVKGQLLPLTLVFNSRKDAQTTLRLVLEHSLK